MNDRSKATSRPARPGRRRRFARAALAALFWTACAAGPAVVAAQTSGSQTSGSGTVVPGVTVRAPKQPPAPTPLPSVEQRDFVRSHAAPSRIGHMTRWRQPVCPTTLGLDPAMNQFVTDRIKAVAAEVGAPQGNCKSDVVIVFTAKPQALMDSVRKKAPALLGFHYPAQAKRLATVTRPIQAWYVTATSSSASRAGLGGLAAGQLSGALGAGAQDGPGVGIDDSDAPVAGGCAGSHFSDCLSNQIVAVVVVADRNEVADHTIGSIADYIAMMVLTKVDQGQDCSELDSISNLMAGKCDAAAVRPQALTLADLAYLKALYSINMTEVMWVQRDSVADIMAKVMAGH